MPDLLTHVLVVYAVMTALTWRLGRLHSRLIPVAMAGTVIPDLAKIELLVPPRVIETVLGIPFSWRPIHRIGGAIVLVGLFALLFDRGDRWSVAVVALFGALSQFPLDGFIRRANGLSPPYLYPVTWWQPPAGDLYLSSDLWPVIPALLLAGAVWCRDRRGSEAG